MASPPAPRAASQAVREMSQREFAECLAQLSDRQWQVRIRATDRLKEAGKGALDRLARAYRTAEHPEVRLRIKEIVEHIVLESELDKPSGFLGVRQRIVTAGDDPRVPPGQSAVEIKEVLPGTAAQKAGLVQGDLIRAVEGRAMEATRRADAFAQYISKLPPGTDIRLTIVRGTQERDLTVTLMARPPEYVDRRSEPYLQALARFAETWRERFDPNDPFVEHIPADPTSEEGGRRPHPRVRIVVPRE